MTIRTGILVAAAGVALGAGANAAVYFTFDDPSTPLELTYVAGSGGSDGSVTYSSTARVDLVVDATEEGYGIMTYSARLSMDLDVGTSIFPPLPIASVGGSFVFSLDDGFGGFIDILTGVADAGSGGLMATLYTGSMNFSNTGFEGSGPFDWTASNDLLTFLGGNQLIGAQSATFALAALNPPVFGLNAENYIPSFQANAAFVGHAEIPAPGGAAFGGLLALAALRRRR